MIKSSKKFLGDRSSREVPPISQPQGTSHVHPSPTFENPRSAPVRLVQRTKT